MINQLKNILVSNGTRTNIPPLRFFWQWLISALAILAECSLLQFYKDGLVPLYPDLDIRIYLNEYGGQQFWLATHSHYFFKDGFRFLTLMVVVWVASEFRKPHFWGSIPRNLVGIRLIIINLISFTALLGVLITVNDPKALIANPHSLASLIYIASPVLWATFIFSIAGILFPIKILRDWALKNQAITAFILVITALNIHQESIELIVNFWSDLLLQPTLDIALKVTEVIGLDAQQLPNGKYGPLFGTNRFVVEIWPECSGYEGMALMIALLATYCFLQRDQLRVYRALWIIPLASFAMFALNGIRIAVLIAIGHFYSPQLALDGFHVVGGWLNLLVVLMASLLTLNTFPYFFKNPHLLKTERSEELLLLLPLIILMIVGLFDQIFVVNFDWLYPAPILLSTLAIFYYRSHLQAMIAKALFSSYAIGIFVFFVWIWLVPLDPIKNQTFFNEITSIPLGLALLWLVFRVIGSVLIVPIAEELAFRGFALPRTMIWMDNFFNKNTLFKLPSYYIYLISATLSLLLTSIIFGMLHSDFLAGLMAGVGFGIAYLLRRKVIDAIVAHAVTNGLLSIYVVTFGYWSYW